MRSLLLPRSHRPRIVSEERFDRVLTACCAHQSVPEQIVKKSLVRDDQVFIIRDEDHQLSGRSHAEEGLLYSFGSGTQLMQRARHFCDLRRDSQCSSGQWSGSASSVVIQIDDIVIWMFVCPDFVVAFYDHLDMWKQVQAQATSTVELLVSSPARREPVLDGRHQYSDKYCGDAADSLNPSGRVVAQSNRAGEDHCRDRGRRSKPNQENILRYTQPADLPFHFHSPHFLSSARSIRNNCPFWMVA